MADSERHSLEPACAIASPGLTDKTKTTNAITDITPLDSDGVRDDFIHLRPADAVYRFYSHLAGDDRPARASGYRHAWYLPPV